MAGGEKADGVGVVSVAVRRLAHAKDLPLPMRASEDAAGFDLLAAVDAPLVIGPGSFALVPTGIAMALPRGYEAQVRPRSGLAARFGVSVLNTPGTIDADYRGEVKVILVNFGAQDFVVERGMRIAQMVITALPQVRLEERDELSLTLRGEGGFGSTGIGRMKTQTAGQPEP